MENLKRKFEGIWIPKELWFDQNLTLQEKIFFIEINSLDNNDGCYASNEYFAKFFGLSKTRVSLIIKSLIDKKYIKSTFIYKENSKEIERRVLNICYTPPLTKVKYPPLTKVKYPPQEKLKDNNTVFNNTVYINKEKKEKNFNFRDTTVLEDKEFIDILLVNNSIDEIKRVITETMNYHKTINNNISTIKLKEHIVNKLKKEKEKKEKNKGVILGSTFQRGNFL